MDLLCQFSKFWEWADFYVRWNFSQKTKAFVFQSKPCLNRWFLLFGCWWSVYSFTSFSQSWAQHCSREISKNAIRAQSRALQAAKFGKSLLMSSPAWITVANGSHITRTLTVSAALWCKQLWCHRLQTGVSSWIELRELKVQSNSQALKRATRSPFTSSHTSSLVHFSWPISSLASSSQPIIEKKTGSAITFCCRWNRSVISKRSCSLSRQVPYAKT